MTGILLSFNVSTVGRGLNANFASLVGQHVFQILARRLLIRLAC